MEIYQSFNFKEAKKELRKQRANIARDYRPEIFDMGEDEYGNQS